MKGLKKGTKVSKNVEKKENPKGNKTSVSYGHAKEKKNNCDKKNLPNTKSDSSDGSNGPILNSESKK